MENNNIPHQPPPAVRFRVVTGSENVAQRPQSLPQQQSSMLSSQPQFSQHQQQQQQRFRYVRPLTERRLLYHRPQQQPSQHHIIKSEMPFSQPLQSIQPRRILRPPMTRVIRPLPIPPTKTNNNTLEDNKKKLINILKSFLNRCSNTPEANLHQMVIATEQYLNGVVSTHEYINILSQNIKGVRETLTSFLELYIYAVRKDIQCKKLTIEECIPFRIVKTGASPQMNTQPIYSNSPLAAANSPMQQQQQIIKSEPMSSVQLQQQQSVGSPMVAISGSNGYNGIKTEVLSQNGGGGSGHVSPIMRTTTNSPHFQFINQNNQNQKNYGNIESPKMEIKSPQNYVLQQQDFSQQRPSPLTGTSGTMEGIEQQQKQQLSPLATESMQPATDFPMETNQTYYYPTQEITVPSPLVSQETSDLNLPGPSTTQTQNQEPEPELSFQSNEPPLSPPSPSLHEKTAMDSTLIDPNAFETYLRAKYPNFTIESPAFLSISEFLETKLRKVVEDAVTAAEHRSEQFRNNPNFVEVENPRQQIKMIEKMEKLQKQRKIEREKEKEALAQRNRNGKTDVTKTNEFLKVHEEKELNRDANEAAIAALGGNKKRPWQKGKKNEKGEGGAPSAAKKNFIPRGKQITMKDLIFAFDRDYFAQNSLVYRKIVYGLFNNN